MGDSYTIGVDFGTLSGRALLVRLSDGAELASEVYEYAYGVMDQALPDGTGLGPDFALQHPQDYLDTLTHTIPAVLRAGGVDPSQVIGIGVDFTACTMLPTTAHGTPLCLLDDWQQEPHSWVKLWKHHAAQEEANQINAAAAKRQEAWLKEYGGAYSSEWFFSKVWQILNEAPEVYAAADRLIEATDWIVWQLTGQETRNACTAGYKAIWSEERGFPQDFLTALDPRMAGIVAAKMQTAILPPGTRAGCLTPAMSAALGLPERTAVAVGHVDAHAAVPAAGVTTPGKLVMVMGTSTCHMVLSSTKQAVEGMCGVVKDGIIPGFYGYEAGQSAVGDIFGWYAAHGVPAAYEQKARQAGEGVQEYLTKLAAAYRPGESGLLALDWWNGNRSILVDADLTGLLLGCTLVTKPEEIYRALLESTAYGTRMIVEAFTSQGIAIDEIYACGGLPERNPLLMQIYADVLQRPIRIAASPHAPALGAAMWAAVAAGEERGGYADIGAAAAEMAALRPEGYTPDPAAGAVYDKLYRQYAWLHDTFGRDESSVMKQLKAIKLQVGED